MRLDDGLEALPHRSAWRFFPWFVALGMGVVIAVNCGMIFAALRSFPGKTGNDGFFLSNHYNQVIDLAADRAALGWSVTAQAGPGGYPLLLMTDRDGAPLTGGRLDVVATRLVGAPLTTVIPFSETSPGRYLGGVPLTVKGQWQMLISVAAGGKDFAVTRRFMAR